MIKKKNGQLMMQLPILFSLMQRFTRSLHSASQPLDHLAPSPSFSASEWLVRYIKQDNNEREQHREQQSRNNRNRQRFKQDASGNRQINGAHH